MTNNANDALIVWKNFTNSKNSRSKHLSKVDIAKMQHKPGFPERDVSLLPLAPQENVPYGVAANCARAPTLVDWQPEQPDVASP